MVCPPGADGPQSSIYTTFLALCCHHQLHVQGFPEGFCTIGAFLHTVSATLGYTRGAVGSTNHFSVLPFSLSLPSAASYDEFYTNHNLDGKTWEVPLTGGSSVILLPFVLWKEGRGHHTLKDPNIIREPAKPYVAPIPCQSRSLLQCDCLEFSLPCFLLLLPVFLSLLPSQGKSGTCQGPPARLKRGICSLPAGGCSRASSQLCVPLHHPVSHQGGGTLHSCAAEVFEIEG